MHFLLDVQDATKYSKRTGRKMSISTRPSGAKFVKAAEATASMRHKRNYFAAASESKGTLAS